MKILFISIITEDVLAQTKVEELIGSFVDIGEAAQEVGNILALLFRGADSGTSRSVDLVTSEVLISQPLEVHSICSEVPKSALLESIFFSAEVPVSILLA